MGGKLHHGQDFLSAELPTGRIQVAIESCRGQSKDLIGIAARHNPARAFLFLSKVLGKHYPSVPAAMEATHQALAAEVSRPNGPVIFIGMAETATGLGQGVFEAWLQQNPGAQALYLQTTRYRVDGVKCLVFEEAHSHAPRLFLHLPSDRYGQGLLNAADLLVLVDDELSTGNTFVNLVRTVQDMVPTIARVQLATIADFLGSSRRIELSQEMGFACSISALMRGSWSFDANGAVYDVPSAQCEIGQEIRLTDTGYGRSGRTCALEPPAAIVEALIQEPTDGPTLVLGTGEFMHAAYVLGRALEKRGIEVRVQATTRSPILRWGAVTQVLEVPDPYAEGVPNYLYNVATGQYARVLICHETSPNASLFQLARTTKGRLIHFGCNDSAEEIPVR